MKSSDEDLRGLQRARFCLAEKLDRRRHAIQAQMVFAQCCFMWSRDSANPAVADAQDTRTPAWSLLPSAQSAIDSCVDNLCRHPPKLHRAVNGPIGGDRPTLFSARTHEWIPSTVEPSEGRRGATDNDADARVRG